MRIKVNFLRLIILVQVALLFLYGTYAWFSDKTNPTINQEDMKVTSAEGLVIKLSFKLETSLYTKPFVPSIYL